MRLRSLALGLAALVTACGDDAATKLTGTTDDGEVFTGVATGTSYFGELGTIQLVSNRGLHCVGQYAFQGANGRAGKATFDCAGGLSGEAILDRTGKTAVGAIGPRKISFSWQ